MDTQLSPANALRTRNTLCQTCLVLATRLGGYAVVKTFPPIWNMLVEKKSRYAATQL